MMKMNRRDGVITHDSIPWAQGKRVDFVLTDKIKEFFRNRKEQKQFANLKSFVEPLAKKGASEREVVFLIGKTWLRQLLMMKITEGHLSEKDKQDFYGKLTPFILSQKTFDDLAKAFDWISLPNMAKSVLTMKSIYIEAKKNTEHNDKKLITHDSMPWSKGLEIDSVRGNKRSNLTKVHGKLKAIHNDSVLLQTAISVSLTIGLYAGIIALIRKLINWRRESDLRDRIKFGMTTERDLVESMVQKILYDTRNHIQIRTEEEKKYWEQMVRDSNRIKTLADLRVFAKKYHVEAASFYQALNIAEKTFNEIKNSPK